MSQTSQATALIRLVFLYAILSCLGVEIAITLRALRENDRTVAGSAYAALDAPAAQIPFLGVTVALEQYNEPRQRREALHRLRAAGFGWVRQRIDWSLIEPLPAEFRWAWTDAVLADIAAAGLTPVVVLDGSPAWARESAPPAPHDSLAPPAAPETYARFAAAFAVRYQDTVRFYQIWDEPNIAPHWGNRHIDPVGYAQLLRAAAIAVRAADPDAVILAAALAPTQDRGHTAIDEGYFLQRLYAAHAAPYFDAVLVQPFGFGTGPDDPRSRSEALNFRRAAWVRRVMVAAGDGETPVWAVRFGWNRQVNDPWKTVSPANQLRFTQQAVQHARAEWPWLTAMGWPADRPNAAASDPIWGFSLITADGRAHPLLSAFSATAHSPLQLPLGTGLTRLALLLLAGGIFLCWAVITARRLPLAQWQTAYRGWPQTGKLALWALLLTTYYVAVWPPLIILCWLLAAFVIAAEPLAGLMIAAAALPFHFQHKELRLVGAVWAVPPAQAALLSTLPALAQRAIRTRVWRIRPALKAITQMRSTQYADWLALAWIGISLLTGLNVWHWPGYVVGFWELVAVPVLLYAGVRLFAAEPSQQRALLKALFVGGVLAAGVGLIDWLSGAGVSVDGTLRLMGVSFSPNQTALYLLRTLFVGVGLCGTISYSVWRNPSGGSQVRNDSGSMERPLVHALRTGQYAGGCLLVAAALALTSSRGAILLGLPAGFLVMAVAGRRHERFRRWLPLMGLLALLVGLLLVLFYGERLLNFDTLRTRLAIWRDAWSLWRRFPLLGVGPGGFPWNYPAFLRPSATSDPNLLHAHSVWLEYATGWGIVGLVWLAALLSWLFSILRRSWRAPHLWLQTGLLAGLWAGLAHAQVDAFAALPELAAWNFVALALLRTRRNDSK